MFLEERQDWLGIKSARKTAYEKYGHSLTGICDRENEEK